MCIHLHSDQGIGQVKLKDAIGTVQRAVEIHVEDKVVASKVARSAWTGLDKFASLLRDQQVLFPLSKRIPHFFKMRYDILMALYDLSGNVSQLGQNFFGEREIQTPLFNKDFFR
jgi:hypothetical protein